MKASRTVRGSGPERRADRLVRSSVESLGRSARLVSGGRLNTAYNCIDRHVAAGRGDALGAGLRQPDNRYGQRFTPMPNRDEVGHGGDALARLGVGKGDRHHLYADDPPTVFAMLACARLGAIHSVVFGGFAPRTGQAIDDAAPKALAVRQLRDQGQPDHFHTNRWSMKRRWRTIRLTMWCCSSVSR